KRAFMPNKLLIEHPRRGCSSLLRTTRSWRSVPNSGSGASADFAKRRGWTVVEVYSDAGISAAKSRNGRPGLDSMLKDASRWKFDIIMAWAIDRLGRSLSDLLDTIQHLEACGVDLFLHQQGLDTTTPAGKTMFQMLGVFAEFEHSIIQERVRAGLQ